MNTKNTIRIARTVTPPERLPFNEWHILLRAIRNNRFGATPPITNANKNIR